MSKKSEKYYKKYKLRCESMGDMPLEYDDWESIYFRRFKFEIRKYDDNAIILQRYILIPADYTEDVQLYEEVTDLVVNYLSVPEDISKFSYNIVISYSFDDNLHESIRTVNMSKYKIDVRPIINEIYEMLDVRKVKL